MANRNPENVVAGVLTAVVVLAFVGWALFDCGRFSTMKPNEWGEFLAGVGGVLALIWLVAGNRLHAREIQTLQASVTETGKAQRSQRAMQRPRFIVNGAQTFRVAPGGKGNAPKLKNVGNQDALKVVASISPSTTFGDAKEKHVPKESEFSFRVPADKRRYRITLTYNDNSGDACPPQVFEFQDSPRFWEEVADDTPDSESPDAEPPS